MEWNVNKWNNFLAIKIKKTESLTKNNHTSNSNKIIRWTPEYSRRFSAFFFVTVQLLSLKYREISDRKQKTKQTKRSILKYTFSRMEKDFWRSWRFICIVLEVIFNFFIFIFLTWIWDQIDIWYFSCNEKSVFSKKLEIYFYKIFGEKW